jgi:hypothetical protein
MSYENVVLKLLNMNIFTKFLSLILLLAIPLLVIFFIFVAAGTCGFVPSTCSNTQPFFWSGVAIFILSLPSAFFISLKSNKSQVETIVVYALYILPLLTSALLFLVAI